MNHQQNQTKQRTSQTHPLHSAIDNLLSSLSNRRQNPFSLLSAARRVVSLSTPFLSDTHLANRLLSLFSKLGSVQDARDLFDQLPHRSLCSYNTLISAYSNAGQLGNALEVFDEMPERDHFSWAAIISAYNRHGKPLQALKIYHQMFQTSKRSELCKTDNQFTASCALVAASSVPCVNYGKQIHCHVIRSEFELDIVFCSALVEMYSKCGYMSYARHLFDVMPKKDVISWSAMMSRYFEKGLFIEGFQVFSDMARCGVTPNEFTFTGLLQACTGLTLEDTGRQVHGKMVRLGACGPSCSFSQSALIHMYSKCGSIDYACNVFDEMTKPDLVSWTAIITGCAQNGLPQKAINYYDLLVKFGFKPDQVTFIGVLTACAHAGLVEKGREIFKSIKEIYKLEYTSDHYACLVDLLSRSGFLEEAEGVVAKMPVEPNKFLWASLLNGSRIYKNLKLGKRAAEALFEIEPDNPATYVTLANIYSSSLMFDEVAKVREIMAKKGMMKKPGSSWITVNKRVHLFLANDESHPQSKEIYNFLEKMYRKIRAEFGYIPNMGSVLHDVSDEQKEGQILYHSERLAVAFGIITIAKEKPIKVFKNLRICVDCHNVMKFISRVSERVIVVRDSNRFHHFKDGICSCGDFW